MEVASAGDGLELKADPRTSTKSIPLLIGLCVVGVLIGGGGLALPHLVGSGDEFAAACPETPAKQEPLINRGSLRVLTPMGMNTR